MLVFDQLKRSDRQLQFLSLCILAGLAILVCGLWYLQVVSVKRFRADLEDQSFRTVRIPAIRGKILDRNRQPLAENRPCYNINLYLEEFRAQFLYEYTNQVKRAFLKARPGVKINRSIRDDLERQARFQAVSNLLIQVSSALREPRSLVEKAFQRHYQSQRSLPFTLWEDLSFEQMALFVEQTPNLVSLSLDAQPIRVYPYKTVAAHLLGHLRRDDDPDKEEEISFQFRLQDYVGVKGIERAFDKELRGKAGVKTVLVNSMMYRQSEKLWPEPEPGQNVILTLDLPIQLATEKALNSVYTTVRGAAVVMDIRTGDILALASAPAFDPNKFVTRFTAAEWANAKMEDPELTPQVNRAAYGEYAPGSIFKIIVGLASLEAGVLDPDAQYHSTGQFILSSKVKPIHDTAGPGLFDFRRAFFKSSNPYFIYHGLKAGPRKIVEMGRQFGLGERTGITQGQESAGYFPSPDHLVKYDGSRWWEGDTANLCIGQGELRVTPLQMTVMTAAVANGGKVIEPRLVMQVEPPGPHSDADVIRFPPGQVRRELKVNPQHLELTRLAMLDDVEHMNERREFDGTGRTAAVKGMRVCGKTGTAQKNDEHGHHKEYVVWFVSYAPYESPRYAVTVVVEGGSSGGGTCAPIAREIYQALLKRETQTVVSSPSVAANLEKDRSEGAWLASDSGPPRIHP